jgi:hypothetical protein
MRVLRSLPYLSYVVDDQDLIKDGVVTYHQGSCSEGINIYNSYYKPGAYLLDMLGNILHTWMPQNSHGNWHYVKMGNNGDLLVSIEDLMLMRLDWDSHIKWETSLRSHHDIAIAEDGNIYTLASKGEIRFMSWLPVPILNEYIVVLSPDGQIINEISLFEILEQDIPVDRIFKIYARMVGLNNLWEIAKHKMEGSSIVKQATFYDVFHNNTITIIDEDLNGVCKSGDVLISVKHLDLIGIVDIENEKLVWSWGPGYLEKQHPPTFLEDGKFLVFDNGEERNYSRIIELDPLTMEVIWQYEASTPTSFYTSWGGAAQRLPNGNTLVTDSADGRVFEITRDGEIVWEFYNPDRDENGKRATIYRMMRITDPENYDKVNELE